MNCKELVQSKKGLIIDKHMTGDIDRLARLMKSISGRDRHGSDLTLYGLKKALVEFLVLFPVYRTYVSTDTFSEKDRFYINETIQMAKKLRPGLLYELNFIEKFLLFKFGEYLTEEEKGEWVDFAMRFQQLTGPLMAKGFEDTTLYIYNRLLSLNEVGGAPHVFGVTEGVFHAFNKKRGTLWPYSINTTATHDTKRGEDVRARLNVLSEIPDEWEQYLKKWNRLNVRKKKTTNGKTAPDKNDEYFLYQTLIGTFPFDREDDPSFVERIKDYMIKAVREAKIHTAWLKPDTEYEELLLRFIDKILIETEQNRFLKEFIPFQRKVAHYGIFNALSQTLLKITSPGVPDFYQGTELWDLSLVDPDNRRPVDFSKRETFLKEIKEREQDDIAALLHDLLLNRENGKIKLFLIHRALRARKERHQLFEKGDYIPLLVEGPHKDHVIAFLRRERRFAALTVVPRFLTSLITEDEMPLGGKIWGNTHIVLSGESKRWRNIFTGHMLESKEHVPVAEILKDFPVALFFNQDRSPK
jgi:(1->4)-alpha-D-glucan 1-alpha-D-glucosylmutase